MIYAIGGDRLHQYEVMPTGELGIFVGATRVLHSAYAIMARRMPHDDHISALIKATEIALADFVSRNATLGQLAELHTIMERQCCVAHEVVQAGWV